MEIVDVTSSPGIVLSGQHITFSFKIIDDGLKDSNYIAIYDSDGSKINYGITLKD